MIKQFMWDGVIENDEGQEQEIKAASVIDYGPRSAAHTIQEMVKGWGSRVLYLRVYERSNPESTLAAVRDPFWEGPKKQDEPIKESDMVKIEEEAAVPMPEPTPLAPLTLAHVKEAKATWEQIRAEAEALLKPVIPGYMLVTVNFYGEPAMVDVMRTGTGKTVQFPVAILWDADLRAQLVSDWLQANDPEHMERVEFERLRKKFCRTPEINCNDMRGGPGDV